MFLSTHRQVVDILISPKTNTWSALIAWPTDRIDIQNPNVLRVVVVGIIVHENGRNPYSISIIDEGVRRALA